MKRLRVLGLMHPELIPPRSKDGFSEREAFEWKTEFDVVSTLREMGHEVLPLGVADELLPIRQAAASFKPHIVFNLLEEFHGEAFYDHAVVSHLELLRIPYTGCNPRGLVLARGKAVSKKLLAYHRIATPRFAVFPMNRKVKRPPKLAFPLIVKSLSEDASLGIAQASVVDSDDKLAERVAFIHDTVMTDAIAEQYVEGREIYVGVLGTDRLQVLPPWELRFGDIPRNVPHIATAKVKHDPVYQRDQHITTGAADLPPALEKQVVGVSKRVYRAIELSGYARLDYRITESGQIHFIEANPNPEIARSAEFAESAAHIGVTYPQLLQRILNLGLQWGHR